MSAQKKKKKNQRVNHQRLQLYCSLSTNLGLSLDYYKRDTFQHIKKHTICKLYHELISSHFELILI